jgi:hypothetical protein
MITLKMISEKISVSKTSCGAWARAERTPKGDGRPSPIVGIPVAA